MLQENLSRILKQRLLLCFLIAGLTFTGNFPAAWSKNDNVAELIRAIRDGETKKADTLIRKGKDINALGDYKWTPLMYAVLGQNIETIEKLLTAGADVNAADQDGVTPLIASIAYAPASYMTQYMSEKTKLAADIPLLLIKNGADPNLADNSSNTPLIYAVTGSHLPIVEALLKKGADLNRADKYGRTALFFINNPDKTKDWAPENGALNMRCRMPYDPSDESRFTPQYAEQVAKAREQANVQLQQIKARIAEVLRGAGAVEPDITKIQPTGRQRLDAKPKPLNQFGTNSPLFEVLQNLMRSGNRPPVSRYNMLVSVASDGTVKRALVVAGIPNGISEQLQKAALKLRYQPAMKNGQPVEDWDMVIGSFSSGPGLLR